MSKDETNEDVVENEQTPEDAESRSAEDPSEAPKDPASAEKPEESVEADPKSTAGWRRWAFPLIALAVGLGIGLMFAPAGEEGGGEDGAHDHEAATTWTCSMHPQIQQPEPGDCPICGMALIPAGAAEKRDSNVPEDHVYLSERARALAEIRTTEVLPLVDSDASRRLLGVVEPAQTRVRTVTAWTNGRIDSLKVASDGERVRRGQTIATMYSPEIYAAHRDLIAAKEQLQKLSSADDFAQRSAERTLDSARQKLRLLGVKGSDLDRMEKANEPWTSVPVRSQFTGTVLSRLVDEGSYVQAGTPIFRIADLSRVWIEFAAYPSDLPYIRVGESVQFEVESIPGTTFTGEITFIDPVVDSRTRTVDVRVEVQNDEGTLRPGMFVEGKVEEPSVGPGEPIPLVVPSSAVLFSGKRSLVYVEYATNDGPVYAPRDVEVGARLGDVFPVIAGLERGERVVTHGAFVIDSDLQINGGPSLMERSATAETDLEVESTPEFDKALKPVVSAYLDAQEALADDDLKKAQANTDKWLAAIDAATEKAKSQRLREAWSGLARVLTGDVNRFANSEDITEARSAFRNLTQSLQRVFATFGNPLEESVRLAYCPMAFDNKGAEWFQRSETVDNAYFGSEMLRCGEIRAELKPDDAENEGDEPSVQPESGASQ